MAYNMTPYLENRIFGALNGTPFSVSALYIGLLTAVDDRGHYTEVAKSDYARQPLTLSKTSDDQAYFTAANNADVKFSSAEDDWGDITHFGIFDAASGGNLLMHGSLSGTATMIAGDSICFDSGMITVLWG